MEVNSGQNRILDVWVEPRSLDPLAAELWVHVRPEHLTPTTEVRGRLMGPACPYAGTVEIAYPLRPPDRLADSLRCRVVIPEPSLWDPQSPFLYHGLVELWQDGQRCDRVAVQHGLRRITLGPAGLRVNGKVFALEGEEREQLDETSARMLRERGRLLLVTPLRAETLPLWQTAERLGFLVLGRVLLTDPGAEGWMTTAGRHASCLGWICRPEDSARAGSVTTHGSLIVIETEANCSNEQITLTRAGELLTGNVRIGSLMA